MNHRRHNQFALLAGLLFALSLLAGRQAPLWRNADGTLCHTCTFASDRHADDCCDTGNAAAVSRDCRDCCIASGEDTTSPQRDRHRTLFVSTPPATPRVGAAAVPRFVERAADYIFPLVHAVRSTPRGSPGLRAPPFSG